MEDSQRIFIPDEILINVLERLPVKTIVRCTALSKSLYSTIKTPGLLKPHVKSSTSSSITNPEECKFLLISYVTDDDDDDDDDKNNCFVLSHDSIVRETFYINFLAKNIPRYVYKVGSCCNGVICLSDIDSNQKSIFLFNPSIRKLRSITPTPLEDTIEKPQKCVRSAVGFGYDEFNDDYKVVVTFRCTTDGTWSEDTTTVMAEVYSLKTNSWKLLEMRDYGCVLKNSVSINNVTYWQRINREDEKPTIVAFDFSAEVFHEFYLPDKYRHGDIHLLTYNGSLGILEFLDDSMEDVRVTMWTLKEYSEGSWNEEFTRVIPGPFFRPVDFTNSGKLIYWRMDWYLTTWDPESGEVVDLDEFKDTTAIIVEDYIESLILL